MNKVKMEENRIEIKADDGKIKRIIALVGKEKNTLKRIQDFLISRPNIQRLNRIEADIDINANEFLNKVIKGDIIEANCENNKIMGTDISQLLSFYLYVGIYTPEQVNNMMECKDIELLPIVIDMSSDTQLAIMLGYDKDPEAVYIRKTTNELINICQDFIQTEKVYDDIYEYLNDDNAMWHHFEGWSDIEYQLSFCKFFYAIKEYNNIYKKITNLDNFI